MTREQVYAASQSAYKAKVAAAIAYHDDPTNPVNREAYLVAQQRSVDAYNAAQRS